MCLYEHDSFRNDSRVGPEESGRHVIFVGVYTDDKQIPSSVETQTERGVYRNINVDRESTVYFFRHHLIHLFTYTCKVIFIVTVIKKRNYSHV